ncbi:MAG: hypothetical protein LBE36_11060 [Flavobacteriaceae bacterium]|nr:hypothetical protein [Flavobacteriaceae bacterium]
MFQKIEKFIERNNLEIKLCFYLFIGQTIWAILFGTFFWKSRLYEPITFTFLYIAGLGFIIYILIKKFGFLNIIGVPVRFVFFYIFLLTIINMGISYGIGQTILNRQKYENLDEFIIETNDETERNYKETFIERWYKKWFK